MTMDNDRLELLKILMPFYYSKLNKIDKNKTKFVHYTSAQAAMSIIQNNEFWMRNTRMMNDYSEIQHGHKCLVEVLKNTEEGAGFIQSVQQLFPGLYEKVTRTFDQWTIEFFENTFISCLSEHPVGEDKFGRLSMWRAYGKNSAVALILNTDAFKSESDILKAYTSPVKYGDVEEVKSEFKNLAKTINQNRNMIRNFGEDQIFNQLFHLFKNGILCLKHPGFKEEREWRVIYTPGLETSDHIESHIEVIGNIPQEVCKIPLKDYREPEMTGTTIPELIDKIIIGPSDNQMILIKAFKRLLSNAGCDQVDAKVKFSGIPLR